jgi:aminomuconate-semialdehyde/2-hydroxymuconate-6-semialdehyde dehydrogenase
MQKIQNYINGSLVDPISNTWLDNVSPFHGKTYSLIADSDERDIEKAFEAAKNAFVTWSKTPKEERSKYLVKIASFIEQNLDSLALAETIDNGKPLSMSKKVDIPRAAANFHFYGTGILHYASHAHDMDGKAINYTLRKPIGVVGCISPWNLPLYLFSWKIAPALAAGNTVVAKPSEITPMTAYLLSKICIEAGLPAGVLNIVHGLGPKVGSALVAHKGIKAISFTGGTKTGAEIARVAAPMFKKLSLELGGKNPNLIFADCDLEKAVDMSIHSSFSNQGQICLCGSRILVEKSIYPAFLEKFIAKAKNLHIGNPNLAQTNIGAVVSEAHMEQDFSLH